MAKRRGEYGNGYIFRKGRNWYGRWRETVTENGVRTIQRSAKLVEYSDRYRTKKDVQPLLNERLRSQHGSNQRFGQFVENIYFPHVERQNHHSTAIGYREKWRNYLKPLCANWYLRDVRTHQVQNVLDKIANSHNLSRATLQRCKSLLSGIFSFAKQQAHYDGVNPVVDTKIPAAKGSRETYAYSLDEIQSMLSVLPNPAYTIIALAAYSGLSKSEIEGLQWQDYDGTQIHVSRGRVRGEFGEPKTPQRKAPVPVISKLKTILNKYRLSVGEPTTGVMFERAGEPEDLYNLQRRVIYPVLRRCGVCRKPEENHDNSSHKYHRDASLPLWRGYHAFRRGLATNLHGMGVDDMTIQKILRHSNVATTQKSYIKTIPKQVTDAMELLDSKLPVQ